MNLNWSKISDWSIAMVYAPYPLIVNGRVFAYSVDIIYRHHGFRRVLFPVQYKRFKQTGKKLAFTDAKYFFNKVCQNPVKEK